jgi:hypothetical protein
LVNLFWGCLITEDDACWITRCEMNECKNDDADDEDDRYKEHEPTNYVGKHLDSSFTPGY